MELTAPLERHPANERVRYGRSETLWPTVPGQIERLIVEGGARRVLEVGAGANPLFSPAFLERHGLAYTALDISADELAKAPACYGKMLGDICSADLPVPAEGFDFVFSRMLAEHVRDGEAFHRNVLRLLAPGGRAFHFFPTLWAPPFVLNRLLPERLAEAVLNAVQPGRERSGYHAKFPAYYHWCRGPTPAQLSRFERLGYEVESAVGMFGHREYYKRLGPLIRVHDGVVERLLARPRPQFTSFMHVTLRRPV
ncbi:MAG: class I SAM-dependent methyltransferase [Rubrivivax sp.]|jgi:SAM-dependent methyltransferase|nr:class I SAM-dependent methyltransferase [Rubrivivax sp.]